MQSYTFLQLFIDCPQTKIVTWVHDTEIHIWKSISRNGPSYHTTPKCLNTPRKCTLGTFYRSETNKIVFSIHFLSRNHM